MVGTVLGCLITQRSQVQILSPLLKKVQARGPFSLRGRGPLTWRCSQTCSPDRVLEAGAELPPVVSVAPSSPALSHQVRR
jgi:hypothetical protein